MGDFINPIMINNKGSVGGATNPKTGEGLQAWRSNAVATLELPGAQAPKTFSIVDGSISPICASVIVDTEDQAPEDELTAISITKEDGDILHDGMIISLQAKDESRVITVKNSATVNGIITINGDDVQLGTTWRMELQLQNGVWREFRRLNISDDLDSSLSSTAASSKALSTHAKTVATLDTAAHVKPDGETIVVDDQGTISAASVPVGAVLAFSGPGTPEGYLLCNGAAVSRTTYAALFAVIGGWNGDGDGSTTFNLPNLSDNRFPQGSTTPGTYKPAGVPEIVGAVSFHSNGYLSQNTSSGAMYSSNTVGTIGSGVAGTGDVVLNFRASYSNNMYGNSKTVQPEALTVRYCIKY